MTALMGRCEIGQLDIFCNQSEMTISVRMKKFFTGGINVIYKKITHVCIYIIHSCKHRHTRGFSLIPSVIRTH